jgi:hypothetical protein
MIVNYFKIRIIIGVLCQQFEWNHCNADNKWQWTWRGLLKCHMCQLIWVGRWLRMSLNAVIVLVIYRSLLSLQTVHFTVYVVRKQKVCLFKRRGHFGWTSTNFLLYEMTCTCGRGQHGLKFRIWPTSLEKHSVRYRSLLLHVLSVPDWPPSSFYSRLKKPDIFTVCSSYRVFLIHKFK